MKKPTVPTPYGLLQVSVRRVENEVRLSVAGQIDTPKKHPSTLGESIWLEYRLDPKSGWYHVDLAGQPWVETPFMTVKPTTREICVAVEVWLRDHRAEVREFLVVTFDARATRARRRVARLVEEAAAELRSDEAFVLKVAQEA